MVSIRDPYGLQGPRAVQEEGGQFPAAVNLQRHLRPQINHRLKLFHLFQWEHLPFPVNLKDMTLKGKLND